MHCFFLGEADLSHEAISIAERRVDGPATGFMIQGSSTSMRVLQRVIAEIAPTDVPVLILGESGTGKEVVACEIHRLSLSKGLLVKVNCSSPNFDSLVDNGQRWANGWGNGHSNDTPTILFDEVSHLDRSRQNLLLNLLPDVGGSPSPGILRGRIIASSSRNLTEEIRNGSFREDLYFRLNGICLRLPSLRERKDDIPVLLSAFVTKYANLLGRQEPRIKGSTVDLLIRYAWPGNVRELENLARKIVILGDDELATSDISLEQNGRTSLFASPAPVQLGSPLPRSLKQAAREASRKAERQLILESLERTHWNRKRSARELQISYKALLYKLKQLGLDEMGSTAAEAPHPLVPQKE